MFITTADTVVAGMNGATGTIAAMTGATIAGNPAAASSVVTAATEV